MKEAIISLFQEHPQLAFLISLSLSILIAVLGLVPSVFITAANIIFFGLWQGIVISFLGEAIGAIIAFSIYRKGLKKLAAGRLDKYPRLRRLLNAGGREAFLLILYLRLIPFVPSGLVTFAASIGRVRAGTFMMASSIGKIPSLLIEGYSVYAVAEFGWQGKLILTVAGLTLVFLTIQQFNKRNRND